jgi:hypothetical protein
MTWLSVPLPASSTGSDRGGHDPGHRHLPSTVRLHGWGLVVVEGIHDHTIEHATDGTTIAWPGGTASTLTGLVPVGAHMTNAKVMIKLPAASVTTAPQP